MANCKRIIFTSLLMAAPLAAMANAPLLLWDNQSGLELAEGCSIKEASSVRFYVSEYTGSENSGTENIRNYAGVKQSYLINGSLVKDEPASRDKSNYKHIQVIGLNKNSSVASNRWNSERGDKGYIFEESLKPIKNYGFKVFLHNDKFPSDTKEFLEETRQFNISKGHYFSLANGDRPLIADCEGMENREFLIFKTFQEGVDGPMFYTGVAFDETSLFTQFYTYEKAQIAALIPEIDEELDQNLVQAHHESEDAVEEAADTLAEIAEETAETNQEDVETRIEQEETVEVTTEYTVCTRTSLNVRGEGLDEVIFRANLGEKVKVFQSFDGDVEQTKTIGGEEYTFKKVEFSDREAQDEKVGYVATDFIMKRSDCRYLNGNATLREVPAETISGLDDEKCCDFPTVGEPLVKYNTRWFKTGYKAGRDGGNRQHAACDLYRYEHEPIRAVAPGRVTRSYYDFYLGTYAIEVRHEGGFVVRYGEITGRRAPRIRLNAPVAMGQIVGYMAKIRTRSCCQPMLHFELYSGKRSGPLKSSRGPMFRRSDIMDPTPYLEKWQEKIFK